MSSPQRLPIWPLDLIPFTWEVSSRRADHFWESRCWLPIGRKPEGRKEFFWEVVGWSWNPGACSKLWNGTGPIARFGMGVVWEINKWGEDARESRCLTQIGKETSLDWKTPSW